MKPAAASILGSSPLARGLLEQVAAAGGTGGSSPLARGLRRRRRLTYSTRRIIPARAGFTCTFLPMVLSRADHPRSRGVYTHTAISVPSEFGSSPLARGLHSVFCVSFGFMGIIPARAGFTPSCATWSGWPPDHPRSRGVYIDPYTEGSLVAGSSPLARGLPESGGHAQRGVGIIPARAGFTD